MRFVNACLKIYPLCGANNQVQIIQDPGSQDRLNTNNHQKRAIERSHVPKAHLN